MRDSEPAGYSGGEPRGANPRRPPGCSEVLVLWAVSRSPAGGIDPRFLVRRLPMFERSQPEFELVDAVPEDLKLGLAGPPPFCSAPQPG